MKPRIVLVLFASFLMTTVMAQIGKTPSFPPDIKIVGVFPMHSMHSQITYKGTGAFHRSNMQQSTDYTRAESGVVPGSETARGAIIPPAGGTFPDSKTAQNHMPIYEPNKTGSGEIDTKSASTANLVRGRIIMQGLSADPAKAKEQMSRITPIPSSFRIDSQWDAGRTPVLSGLFTTTSYIRVFAKITAS